MTNSVNDDWHFELHSDSPQRTGEIGRKIGRALVAGDVVGLAGPLGAGKTQLAKGIAGGLGLADERQVTSPTFVLVNEYEGRLHIYHLDVFRLCHADELAALGFDEMCNDGSVVLLEWAQRVQSALNPDTLWIEMQVIGQTDRRLTFRSQSRTLAKRLNDSGLDRS